MSIMRLRCVTEIYIYIYIYIYMCVCVCSCMCVFVCVHVRIRVCMCLCFINNKRQHCTRWSFDSRWQTAQMSWYSCRTRSSDVSENWPGGDIGKNHLIGFQETDWRKFDLIVSFWGKVFMRLNTDEKKKNEMKK